MPYLTLSHTVKLPDPMKLERFRRAPKLGPRLLFFSGGTALRELSQELVHYTHRSIHIITPFDSGGSSARLREAFGMPAVGDIRNRLMALADCSLAGNSEILELFSYRFPKDETPKALWSRLARLLSGKDRRMARVPYYIRHIVQQYLEFLAEDLPSGFDLRNASVGNFILASGYCSFKRRLDPAIYFFAKLVETQGIVRPVLENNLYLGAELEDDNIILGQHRLTGKGTAPIGQSIRRLFLSKSLNKQEPTVPAIPKRLANLIGGADLICYPPGSFWTSIIANLLPAGVGQAVAMTNCPKIYVPNSAPDPEQVAMTLSKSVNILLATLRADCNVDVPTEQLLNVVLIDGEHATSLRPEPAEIDWLAKQGITVVDLPLSSQPRAPWIDGRRLAKALLSIV
ncbi:conserved hypothetical protein [Desulfovibrionales bacterium]